MTTYLNDFKAAVRTAIAAMWPEVIPNGISESENLESFPWAEKTIPFATYQIHPATRTDDYGTASHAFIVVVDFVYVGEIEGKIDPIRQKIEDAKTWLFGNSLSAGMILSCDKMDWSPAVAGNAIFAEKAYNQWGAQMTCTFLIGEFQ